MSATIAPTVQLPIRLDGVSKHYGDVRAVDDVSVTIPAGSLSVIVGPSGCGKSTLLKLLAGLEQLTHGRLLVADQDISHTPAEDRRVSMVFQDYALYPHMSVEQNIGFGLRMQQRHNRASGLSAPVIAQRVRVVAEQLGLDSMLRRRPAQLSGGQQQRVALARAIVRNPGVLLLDEPLSALDAQLRVEARSLISSLHRSLGATMVMVTHDQHEALSMATHLIVMDHGKIAQAGSPQEVYQRPVSPYVGSFLGTPPMNLQVLHDATIGWRAEDAQLLDAGASPRPGWTPDGDLVIEGIVELTEFSGSNQLVHCRADDSGERFSLLQFDQQRWLRMGEQVRVLVPAARVHRW